MNSVSSDAATDLRQFVRPIWARHWMITALVVLVTVATFVYYDRRPDRFRAESTIFVQTSELEQSLFGVLSFSGSERTTANQARLLRTEDVAREVARRIGYRGDPRALLQAVQTEASTQTDFITITA